MQDNDNLFRHNFLEETSVMKVWRVDPNDPMKDSDSFNFRTEELMMVLETMLKLEKFPAFREAAKNILIAQGTVRENHIL